MGNGIFFIVLSLSLSGILVGAMLFALKPIISHRFSRKWQYYIWLILIIRLLVPVTIETNLIGSIIQKAELKTETVDGKMQSESVSLNNNAEEKQNRTENSIVDRTENDTENDTENRTDRKSENNAENNRKSNVLEEENPLRMEELLENIWIIWIFGVLLFFTLKIADYGSFFRYVRANNEEITDETILAYLDDIMMDLNIRKNIEIYQNKLMLSPMIAGFRKPFIVLPKDLPDEWELRYILAHELMHYKKKDIWYKWMFQVTSCIHWFNPFLLLVNKEINKSCELACDEAVIKHYSIHERKEYGNMLLNLADQGIRYRNNVLSTTLIENKKNLKERLKNIMDYKKLTKMTIICSIMVICFISGFAIAAGAKYLPNAKNKIEKSNKSDIAAEPILDILQESEKEEKSEIEDYVPPTIPSVPIEDRGALETDDKIKKSNAAKTYEDDTLIAGRDTAHNFAMSGSSWNNKDGNMKMDMFRFKGATSLRILYMKKPLKIEINYSANVTNGKCKLVQIGPDNEVNVLFEGSKTGKFTTLLPEGRSAFKLVSTGTTKDLDISFGKIDKNSVLADFNSESSEESMRLVQKVIKDGKVKLDELIKYAKDMDSEDVSYCVITFLKANGTITESQWRTLLEYSDEEILGSYLLSLIQSGKTVDVDTMRKLIPGMSEENVSEYLIYLMDNKVELSDEDLKEMVFHADEKIMGEYVFKLIQSGKAPDNKKMSILVFALDEKDVADCIFYMVDHNMISDYAQLQELSYYADEDMLDEYVRKQMESGKMDYRVFNAFAYSLSEEIISDYILDGLKKDNITVEQITSIMYNAEEESLGNGILELAKNKRGFSFDEMQEMLYVFDEDVITEYIKIMIPKQKDKSIAFILDYGYSALEEDAFAECINYAIDKGVRITYADMEELAYKMNSKDFTQCINKLVKNKELTSKQAKELQEQL